MKLTWMFGFEPEEHKKRYRPFASIDSLQFDREPPGGLDEIAERVAKEILMQLKAFFAEEAPRVRSIERHPAA